MGIQSDVSFCSFAQVENAEGPVISEPIFISTNPSETKSRDVKAEVICGGNESFPDKDDHDQAVSVTKDSNYSERSMEEQAATKAQSVFRGYLVYDMKVISMHLFMHIACHVGISYHILACLVITYFLLLHTCKSHQHILTHSYMPCNLLSMHTSMAHEYHVYLHLFKFLGEQKKKLSVSCHHFYFSRRILLKQQSVPLLAGTQSIPCA